MRTSQRIVSVGAVVGLATVMSIVGAGQGPVPQRIGGPLTGPPVRDAPFSADAATSARVKLPDGTRLDQRTTARYYRDRQGRARVELNMESLPAPTTVSERHIRTIVAPDGKDGVFTLDPVTRTTRYLSRSWLAYAAGGEGREASKYQYVGGVKRDGLTFAVPIGADPGNNMPYRFLLFRRAQDYVEGGTATEMNEVRVESLGMQRIAGVDATGRRTTITVPRGELENDEPFQMVDERWESPELKLLVAATLSDSRMGEVEYRLANISRDEQPADLFTVPGDYTLDTNRTPRETWIALVYADKFPTLGEAWAHSSGPR